jgi:hypothetical protein
MVDDGGGGEDGDTSEASTTELHEIRGLLLIQSIMVIFLCD